MFDEALLNKVGLWRRLPFERGRHYDIELTTVMAIAGAIASQGLVEHGGCEYEGLMLAGDKTDVSLDQIRQVAALAFEAVGRLAKAEQAAKL
jgi:phage protein D